jgi:hypothetical protein
MSIWDSLISAGGSIAGGLIQGAANKNAADAQKDALKRQIKFLKESRDLANQRLDASKAAALGILSPYQAVGQPAIGYQQAAMNQDPSQLTPSQQLALEDLQRRINNNQAVGGLRGAGRAGAAAFDDATRRYMASAYDENQRRADTAANTLTNIGYGAGRAASNAELGVGTQEAGNITSTGSQVGNALANIGSAQGNAISANGSIASDTLGAIAQLLTGDQNRGKSLTEASDPNAATYAKGGYVRQPGHTALRRVGGRRTSPPGPRKAATPVIEKRPGLRGVR